MIDTININQWIYQRLSSDDELKSLVDTQIYPIVVEENGKFPFVVFTRRNAQYAYDNDGLSGEQCNIVLTAVAKDYVTTVSIIQRLRKLLEFCHEDGIYSSRMQSLEEGYYNNCYVQTITISFQF